MKMKKIEIAVWGEEIVRHKRHLCVEVPEDVTDEELCELASEKFDDVEVGPEWWVEESDGICGAIDSVDIVADLQDEKPVHCQLQRNSHGELVVVQ